MLTIRRDQIRQLEKAAHEGFERRAMEHLRDELAPVTAALGDTDLLERVRLCIPRARRYGLASEAELMAFVDATYLLDDPDFDANPDYPWAPDILGNPHMTPREKALQLLDCAFVEHEMRFDGE